MECVLRWDGGIECVATLARLRGEGHDVRLAFDPDAAVAQMLLDEQAGMLGAAISARLPLPLEFDVPEHPTTRTPDERKPEGNFPKESDIIEPDARRMEASLWRAFVVESVDASHLGRFLDDPLLEGAQGLRTFVIDGPMFARRVEIAAFDVQERGGRWRLELGLRGC